MKTLHMMMNRQWSVRFVAAVTVVSLLLSALPAPFLVANATALNDNPFGLTPLVNDHKVRICHAAGNGGYVSAEISVNAIINGTGHGADDDDIIPPFVYFVGVYPGQNWFLNIPNILLWIDDCGSEPDQDEDGIPDDTDNCPAIPNEDQLDTDDDGEGDVCDATPNGDEDGDGVDDETDNCPSVPNPNQENQDQDEYGDACEPAEPVAVINLTKIVCEDESLLPNDGFTSINESTATNFLESTEGCALESGFSFQWAFDGQDVYLDNQGAQGAPWTTTNPTVNGVTTVTIPAAQLGNGRTISVREVWSDDYIPFTGRNTDQPVSAEIYCANDAANYDNLEWIGGVTANNTYHCVAWNVEVEEPPMCAKGYVLVENECVLEPQECQNLLTNGSFETPVVENDSLWDKFAVVTGWSVEQVLNNSSTTLELHRNWSSNDAAHGQQYAELDGDHSTKITQNVALIEGATYKLSWAFAPRHDASGAEQNQLSVLINGTQVASNGPASGSAGLAVGDWIPGSYNFEATANNASITFADAGPSNSYGTFLDDARLCKIADPEPVATVVAEKVVCTTEEALPNWGANGATDITSTTAADWVAQSDGRCALVPNWQFEWAGADATDPGDTLVGVAGAGWTTSSVTDVNGKTTIELTEDDLDGDSHIWMREVLKDGFIPFTHEATPDNSNNVSAEFYCHIDGLNYDNLDRVDGIEVGEEYHCVAFNVEKPKPAPVCELEIVSDATTVIDTYNLAVPTWDEHSSWTDDITGATWIWNSYKVPEPEENESHTFTETFTVTDPSSLLLDIAADNSYRVFVDGNLAIDRSTYENNFADHTTLFDQNLLAYLNPMLSEHTLTIEVTNLAQDDGTYQTNPAGTLFKLNVAGETNCVETTEPEPIDPPMCDEGYVYDEEEEACVPEWSDEDETFILDGYKYEVEGDSEPTPVAGWTIYAENFADESNEVLSTTTDATGYYWFEVEEGDWKVTEAIPEGWEQDHVTQNGETTGWEVEGPQYCAFEVEDEILMYKKVAVMDYENDYRCNFYNEQTEDIDVPETPDNNSNGGGDSSSGTKVKKKAPTGQVLGASTDQCSMYLFDYMREGIENKEWEVKKLQMFLNIVEGNSLEVNGVFDDATDAAVRKFQMKYQADVLTPWFVAGIVPHNNSTGWVYQLTRWKINNIVCPGSEPLPTLLP